MNDGKQSLLRVMGMCIQIIGFPMGGPSGMANSDGSFGLFATDKILQFRNLSLFFVDRNTVFFGSLEDFCKSREMEKYFGSFGQHIVCHRHDKGKNDSN